MIKQGIYKKFVYQLSKTFLNLSNKNFKGETKLLDIIFATICKYFNNQSNWVGFDYLGT